MKQVFNDDSLEGKTFAIQGMGKTGMKILEGLYPYAERVYITDIDPLRVKLVKNKFPKVKVAPPDEIHKKDVDVFCPCALSNAITRKNVASLRCKIIAGSANNQLEDDLVGEMLYKAGIVYAPDYIANAGGLIAVVDEYENGNNDYKRLEKRVKRIENTLQLVFEKSNLRHKPPNIIADRMAKRIADQFR